MVLSCVCVFFKYKYAYDFPFIFQLLLLPVCGLYTSREQLHTYFLFVKKKIVSPSSFSLFAWCRGVVYIKLVIWINMYRYLQRFSSVKPTEHFTSFVCPNFFTLITYLLALARPFAQQNVCLVLPHLPARIDIFKISSTNSRRRVAFHLDSRALQTALSLSLSPLTPHNMDAEANKLLSLVRSHATFEQKKTS